MTFSAPKSVSTLWAVTDGGSLSSVLCKCWELVRGGG
ncbi:hypothetical protein [Cryobacterium luteum]|nr:hypothetical protein [Cryobacterium luteum]